MMKKIACSVLLAFLSAGCVTLENMAKAPAADAKKPEDWVPQTKTESRARFVERALAAGDEVKVQFHTTAGARENGVSDIVDSFGNITLPLVGEVKVSELTTSEAEKAIRDAFVNGGFYSELNVTVLCPTIMKEQERTYSVTGCVNRKGTFPYRENLTLWEAIIAAGDLSTYANGKVRLIRNGETTTYTLDLIKKHRVEDPKIEPRDILEACESFF